MTFKLIVFDWDGTLMDSEARIVDSMQGALEDIKGARQTAAQVRDIIGLGLTEAVRALLPEDAPAVHEAVVRRYRQRYLGSEGVPTPLFTGAGEVIKLLAEQEYLLAVATGKGRRGLDQALESSGLRDFFHATRCPDEAFSKPHPEMLLQIMTQLGTLPAETLMVGDTEYDMQLASNAGTAALAVSYGVQDAARLQKYQPLACLDDVRALPAWLSAHN
jgi:phosphoglycolate phosphatase